MQENEDIRRRLETATCGGRIESNDAKNISVPLN
jgi:hypothetical protein